jgi:hypothetical protein
MATETTTDTTTTRARGTGSGTTDSGDAVQTAVREVRGAIDTMSRSVPEVARASRTAVDDLFRVIETGSDERVTAGVSLSLGLALGMLLGSAPRLLVIIALAPVVAAGLVLADRRTKTSSTTSRAAT